MTKMRRNVKSSFGEVAMVQFHLRHLKNVKPAGVSKYALNFASTHSTPRRRAAADALVGCDDKVKNK